VLINPGSDTRTGVLVEYARTAQICQDAHGPRSQAYVTDRIG
jgi:hypothetical protein